MSSALPGSGANSSVREAMRIEDELLINLWLDMDAAITPGVVCTPIQQLRIEVPVRPGSYPLSTD